MAFDKEQFRDLIERVLKETKTHSESAVNLLLGTAAVESWFGTYLRQAYGPALGVFQMEPATEEDIWENFFRGRYRLRQRVVAATGRFGPYKLALESDIAYQIAIARCHYLRFPEALPFSRDIEAMAGYWKRYYNTEKGKGTIEKFIECYALFVERPKGKVVERLTGSPGDVKEGLTIKLSGGRLFARPSQATG